MKKHNTILIVMSLLAMLLLNLRPEPAKAQSQFYPVLVGDTIVLNVTGANGSIQWQQSTDSLNWTDISGATTTPYQLITSASATGKRFFRAKITNTSICELSPWYSSIIRHKIITSTTQVAVGDWFHGGIVFYTDGSGHGLIAPQQDQSTSVQWGCYGTSIPGATSPTDGAANTTAIVAACTTTPIAASVCNDLVLNGYNDWFLPAKDQLNYLYQQRSLVGGFTNNYYWSSSENGADLAWSQYFNNGDQDGLNKINDFYVRCVRSF